MNALHTYLSTTIVLVYCVRQPLALGACVRLSVECVLCVVDKFKAPKLQSLVLWCIDQASMLLFCTLLYGQCEWVASSTISHALLNIANRSLDCFLA